MYTLPPTVSPHLSSFSGEGTPGKRETSLEQWAIEVESVQGHYPEEVLWENIVRSLRVPATHIVRYLGAQACVTPNLSELEMLYGTVISFDVLLQSFYCIHKIEGEKVLTYVTRLEGSLNLLRVDTLVGWEKWNYRDI